MAKKHYRRLDAEDREAISRGLAAGLAYHLIAERLERSVSTITREVKRNYGASLYRACAAQRKAEKYSGYRRGGQRKINKYPRLQRYVEAKLGLAWSPDEIARRLRLDYAQDMTMQISHQAIYEYIYVLPRGELKATLIKGLRQEHKYRHRRKDKSLGADQRGHISDMLSIEERPEAVAQRTVPGHWEGDLIMGKNKKTAIGTLVERVTRYTMIVHLKAKDAQSVRKAYADALQKLPQNLAKSLTYDQGKEMSDHKRFTIATGIKVYFAHPSSPWERGTNENTNGLIRQFFPKGTDFAEVSPQQVRKVQNLLNNRPRKILEYRTPNEVFNHLVALDS
jgi:IS30 family transposase